MLPAFPRVNSNTSGFFFCGIRLEPVEKASFNVKKPNSDDGKQALAVPPVVRDAPHISSAKHKLSCKIPIRYGIHAVLADLCKSQFTGQCIAINRETGSGYSTTAQRQNSSLVFEAWMNCWRSRSNAQKKDNHQWLNNTGCARCKWV